MKNTINIYQGKCACLSSANDGTNRIFIEVITGENENPRLIIGSKTISLSKNNTESVQIASSQYPTSGGNLTVQYIDDVAEAQAITLVFGTIDESKNMMLKKSDEATYIVQYIGTNGGSGQDGKDGRTPEIQVIDNIIKWRYTDESDAAWREIISLADLEGQDGKDGRGIVSIKKTSSKNLIDTYTIIYTDNTTSTFTVTNGQDGQDGTDYIVETGTKGIWTYQKWNSGIAECFGEIPVSNLAITIALGSLYRSTVAYQRANYTFPFEFKTAPTVSLEYQTTNRSGAMIWVSEYATTTEVPSIFLIRPTSATTTGKVMVQVKGKWK